MMSNAQRGQRHLTGAALGWPGHRVYQCFPGLEKPGRGMEEPPRRLARSDGGRRSVAARSRASAVGSVMGDSR